MKNKKITELSENGVKLEENIRIYFKNKIPMESEIVTLASALRVIPNYWITDDEYDQIIMRLHESLTIYMGLGSCVEDNSTPWLLARKAEIDPFYWGRYKSDLLRQGWPHPVVDSLDKVTDQILDRVGDPFNESGWSKRGLVMGDVQSGKTSNYTGLICKAADAGYKLVILLTGTLESLRRQTQERLDSGFVGLESAGIVNRTRQRRLVGVGLINPDRDAGVFTSTMSDFKEVTANQLGFKLKNYSDPVLLVVKKNKRILENLTNWLTTYNANNAGKINLPLLLIDDEADNASVNTNPKKATAINASIRNLLNVFPRSSYIGFTATPFANVFINPDTTNDMLGDDLFPRDFIYTLDAPTNYFGATKIFGEESNPKHLKSIDDAEAIFGEVSNDNNTSKGVGADGVITEVPNSLIIAMHCFVVVNAIMDLRSNSPKHRSMLVNITHYTNIQNQVADILDGILRRIQEDIRHYSMLSDTDSQKNSTMLALHSIYLKEYAGAGVSWDDVKSTLAASSLSIQMRTVNQKSGAASLDYSIYGESGLRVIAVGGNSLARGITLEGLCVSYFYRRTQMYDALLQMGRWFGYRTGYEDLFRIWISDTSSDWYSYIAIAADELRDAIRQMQNSRLKPVDVGLRVRAHPEALLITARNKMRDSEEITGSINISNELKETTRLSSEADVILRNYVVTENLTQQLIEVHSNNRDDEKFPFWKEIPKNIVADFLERYLSHPLDTRFPSKVIANFIRKSGEDILDYWDIAFPRGQVDFQEFLGGFSINALQRQVTLDSISRSYLVGGSKRRLGDSSHEKIGLSVTDIGIAETEFRSEPENKEKTISGKAYRKQRKKPLLLLYLLEPYEKGSDQAVPLPERCKFMVAVGLIFPALKNGGENFTYRINLVELRNLLPNEVEYDPIEDEELDEDESCA
ncbi:Z1 domain-containing protein [Cellvibrio sp. UBA7671]|uniref:Z1 domain-containing protein n=1 Tax=Cellvibrio sp. UBA7671 TaxID=1946312 RepID=UPI002F350E17